MFSFFVKKNVLSKIVRKKYRKEYRFTSLISPQKQDSREEKLTDGQKVGRARMNQVRHVQRIFGMMILKRCCICLKWTEKDEFREKIFFGWQRAIIWCRDDTVDILYFALKLFIPKAVFLCSLLLFLSFSLKLRVFFSPVWSSACIKNIL